nr:hypothetical protein CFP56_38755 [Quercus suber]
MADNKPLGALLCNIPHIISPAGPFSRRTQHGHSDHALRTELSSRERHSQNRADPYFWIDNQRPSGSHQGSGLGQISVHCQWPRLSTLDFPLIKLLRSRGAVRDGEAIRKLVDDINLVWRSTDEPAPASDRTGVQEGRVVTTGVDMGYVQMSANTSCAELGRCSTRVFAEKLSERCIMFNTRLFDATLSAVALVARPDFMYNRGRCPAYRVTAVHGFPAKDYSQETIPSHSVPAYISLLGHSHPSYARMRSWTCADAMVVAHVPYAVDGALDFTALVLYVSSRSAFPKQIHARRGPPDWRHPWSRGHDSCASTVLGNSSHLHHPPYHDGFLQ